MNILPTVLNLPKETISLRESLAKKKRRVNLLRLLQHVDEVIFQNKIFFFFLLVILLSSGSCRDQGNVADIQRVLLLTNQLKNKNYIILFRSSRTTTFSRCSALCIPALLCNLAP